MAPPPPGIVEVGCAGCGETMEVENGMTEFACPDCGTAQALPPELMPRRPRRALPLPGRGAPFAPAPSHVSCGGCSALLSVPHGQGCFACPLCGTKLAASPAAVVAVVEPPAAVPITPGKLARLPEVRDKVSSQSTHTGQVQKPIHSGQARAHGHINSLREESFSSFRADTRKENPVVARLQNEPANPSYHGEESRTEPLNGTISRPLEKKSRYAAGQESSRARMVQEQRSNQAIHASQPLGMPIKSSVHTGKAEDRFPNGTVTMHSKQKIGYVDPRILELEQITSQNKVSNEQQVQVDFPSKAIGNGKKSTKDSKRNQKRKVNCSSQLPQLRRSKRLVNGSNDLTIVDLEPIEKIYALPNQHQSEASQIERTLADPDSSSPAQYRFPHGGSNDPDDVDATTSPATSHGTQQAEQFPHGQMYSPETRWTLPIPISASWLEHEIPQESFNGIDQLGEEHEEVRSNPSAIQNQDMDGQLAQEACGDKNRSGWGQLKPNNENLSEHGRQNMNGFIDSSVNDVEHPGDKSYPGIRCQINLSASCSRLATSLPFSPAATSPVIMLPSSRESLSPFPSQSPPPLYSQSQDAPCGDERPGSISKLSNKRRGRAPEKLMEPRKEADRPVLTARGADWNVHPSCPKVANTLSLLIKQNYPGTYLSVDDTSTNNQPCELVIYRWHQCPPDIKATVLDEFLKRYKWSPGQEEECQKIFVRKASRQLVNLFCYEKQRVREELAAKRFNKSLAVHRVHGEMGLEEDHSREDSADQQGERSMLVLEYENPLQWKPFVPGWMKPKWWQMLCDHWAKDEVLKASYQNRKNRNSGKHPCNTAGSRNMTLQQHLVGMDNGGKLVVDIDPLSKIPSATRESVVQETCQTEDTTDQHTAEAGDSQLGFHPVKEQVGSRNRGGYCSDIGVSRNAQNGSLSKSCAGCVSKQRQEAMFTKEEVHEMINKALQGLNEVWEKKFLSLEQKMPSPSSYIVPGVSGKLQDELEASLVVGRSKQCKLARQDTFGSVDGEEEDPV